MSEEWGPWIEHDGMTVPSLDGLPVHLVFENGDEFVGIEGTAGYSKFGARVIPDDGEPYGWLWDHPENEYGDSIIRYRVRKPRALLNLIDMVENLPADTKVDA